MIQNASVPNEVHVAHRERLSLHCAESLGVEPSHGSNYQLHVAHREPFSLHCAEPLSGSNLAIELQ